VTACDRKKRGERVALSRLENDSIEHSGGSRRGTNLFDGSSGQEGDKTGPGEEGTTIRSYGRRKLKERRFAFCDQSHKEYPITEKWTSKKKHWGFQTARL